MNYDVLVIGGGAAGMMAAGTAAQNGLAVCLLDKNPILGKKIRITGKGRCNVTNNCMPQTVIDSTPTNGRFLYSAISRFPPSDTIRFFEGLGLPLKTERGNRVFPVSDHASDVAEALIGFDRGTGVHFIRGEAERLLLEGGAVHGAVLRGGTEIHAANVAVCCGGASYPATGSTGDGYRFAKQAGHTVTPLFPSLVPLTASGDDAKDCRDMMGLSLKNVSVRVLDAKTGKTVYEDFGEMLFTHFGLSGPMILSASAHMHRMSSGRYRILIDLKPALTPEKLDARLQRDFGANLNRDFSNSLSALLPRKMIPVAVRHSGIPPKTKCHALTREMRHSFGGLLKSFPITIEGFRPIEEAIVTSGGISTKEVNPQTMQSKLVRGLYFAGEVIDVDAYTGGFNLQIAFSTGRLAGSSMERGESSSMKNGYTQSPNPKTAIAIDGPAGAGKSTIARRAAAELGFLYVDTGSLYRAIALFMLENEVDPSDPTKVCPLLNGLSVSLAYQDGEQRVFLNRRDVTGQIRSAEVSLAASKVSAIPEVRKFLLSLQRRMAEEHNVVMDGRDIGTVVLPNACVKVFLTASAEDRARRRYEEMTGKGVKTDYKRVLDDLKQRDYKDEHRAISPLRCAEDAVRVDTTGNTLEQSVEELIHLIRGHLEKK